jgi:hypothetical protein
MLPPAQDGNRSGQMVRLPDKQLLQITVPSSAVIHGCGITVRNSRVTGSQRKAKLRMKSKRWPHPLTDSPPEIK